MSPSPSQSLPLAGKTALVTGGARGIGLATVRALAQFGATVTFTARDSASGQAAEEALAGLDARARVCDINDRGAVTALMRAEFDILVNNAAIIAPIGRITELSTEAFAESIQTNLVAQFDLIRQALPSMVRRGDGVIVNISSGAAHRPQEGWSAYCSGKAGLAMLTRSVHHEYGAQGIRIYGIAPGVVDTGMQGEIRASGINPVSQLPRTSLAPADEPGRAVAWLCTEAAGDRAGQELDIRTPELRAAIGLPPLA